MLYLHGFASCGEGNKSRILKKYFLDETFFAPNLPYSPFDAIEALEKLIQTEQIDILIGSSLGGFYATYLAEKYHLKAILLNPSTEPWQTLSSYIGWQKRFCDDESFEFKEIYLTELKRLSARPENGTYLVLLQSDDEVLDYTKALSLYNKQKVVVEYGGNHRFENINDYLCMIDNFRK